MKGLQNEKLRQAHHRLVAEVEAMRVQHGFSRTGMADFIGWDKATYSRFINMKRPLSDGMLGVVAFTYPRLFAQAMQYRNLRRSPYYVREQPQRRPGGDLLSPDPVTAGMVQQELDD